MKQMLHTRTNTLMIIVAALFALFVSGCFAGDLDTEPLETFTHEAADQSFDSAEIYEANTSEDAAQYQLEDTEDGPTLMCVPGPSSNWCQNVDGKSCSTPGTIRRCFLPNYCEWLICRCNSGTWNCGA